MNYLEVKSLVRYVNLKLFKLITSVNIKLIPGSKPKPTPETELPRDFNAPDQTGCQSFLPSKHGFCFSQQSELSSTFIPTQKINAKIVFYGGILEEEVVQEACWSHTTGG